MLEIEAVDVFYGRIQALREVSLKLEEGEVYTVIGANGAGKTTLMRAIMGLKKVSRGRIRFMGEDISDESTFERARRGISMVPEGRGLFPDFTVKENLLIGAF
ncbi:MAG: ATP-binding cassette domain-containing protein, partial [Candidatus Bipolaricaulia bacterium]